ncbi:hypothetical protein V6N12_030049 [Hibiscus sabdariffa]|uniref:Uncharacterized protein n=1 Tax=Hibiscus sabdariffa TaxID=183260 RepID=A0ABR2CKZ9_9ROSI
MMALRWEIWPAPEGKEAMDSTCLKWLVVVSLLGEEDAMTMRLRDASPPVVLHDPVIDFDQLSNSCLSRSLL